jgi:predicted DNA-binding protein (MmcQ/YjbR family)
MISASDLRTFALALPGAHEEPHFDRASFRVVKKIFLTLTDDGKEAMVKLKDPELVGTLLMSQPEVYFSYGGWTVRGGALGVRLVHADAAELLESAWQGVVPKPRASAR